MTPPPPPRRAPRRLALAKVAAASAVVVVPLAVLVAFGGSSPSPITAVPSAAAHSATAPTAAQSACARRVNDSPAKLVDCVRTADLWQHLVNFQKIADANPGPDGHPSRNSGEPGYKASADYVAEVMRAAGYHVTMQQYTFRYFSFLGTPVFTEESPTPHAWTVGKDFTVARVAGATTAKLQPAGGIVVPATSTPSSASGCSPSDFADFTPGNIALIQRGACTFGTKAANAEAAGATGVVFFNEGNPGRTGLVSSSLPDGVRIPVVFTPYAVGAQLLTEYKAGAGTGPSLTIKVRAIEDPNRADWNVIAESTGGDPNNVLVVDAHLDAIYGAGMLDNASGSAALLDIAQQLQSTSTRNKLRFIWFGGEELGLLGSIHYIDTLPRSELAKIKFDLDADVLGTPNYVAGVLDPRVGVTLFGRTPGTPRPPSIFGPSAIGRDFGIDYLSSIGKKNILFSADGTDAFTFQQVGIPASGVLTGQDCCKLQSDVTLFGGYAGNFEGTVPGNDGGCVDNPFRWCDNLSDNDPQVLTWMSKTFASMVAHLAYDTQVFTSADSGGHVKAAPARATATAQVTS